MKKAFLLAYQQARILQSVGMRSYLRYRFAPGGTELSLPINGKPILIRKGTPDLGVALSCLNGEFEILAYLLPKDYSGVIVDAGGYIGTSALALSELFPQSRIIVIEPSQKNIKILKVNVSGLKNVEVVYGALVGKKADTIALKNRGTGEWGFTAVENPRDNSDAVTLHETPAFTLDQLGLDPSDIGILKLDIEGGEFDILQHDSESLAAVQVVFAELHDRIIDGCTDLFLAFSRDRVLIKDKGEKFLSVKR